MRAAGHFNLNDPQPATRNPPPRISIMRILALLLALATLAIFAVVFGKRHARRFQRSRRIHIDRFKLKRRHADIELEVFGSREIVEAVRTYAHDRHVSTEEAVRQAKTYPPQI